MLCAKARTFSRFVVENSFSKFKMRLSRLSAIKFLRRRTPSSA